MHDKMNNEESLSNLVNNLNDYFNLDSLDIDDNMNLDTNNEE